jgi:hypothetical protein
MGLVEQLQPYVRRAFQFAKPPVLRLIGPRHTQDQKHVTFLSGFARSGTNMVMEVFEWSGLTEVFREGDPRVNDTFRLLDDATVRSVVLASPSQFVLVKALQESHRLAALMDLFPGSGAMWMYRHYDDCVNSILQRWPGHRNGIDDIVRDGANASGWRGEGTTDATLARLRAQYRQDWNDATCNAWFWCLRHQLFFDQHFETRPGVALVRYESLVTDPLRVIRPLADIVGVKLTGLMASVPNARSIGKRAPPDIAPDVRETCDALLARLDAVWEGQGF